MAPEHGDAPEWTELDAEDGVKVYYGNLRGDRGGGEGAEWVGHHERNEH